MSVTPAIAVCRYLASLRRVVTALLLGGVVGAVASRATAQTTTLSGTTTGNVSIAASSGTPSIVGNSVLTGTANFFYSGEGSLGATGTMTSNLSGTGALRFSSPATLVISGTNTYSGGTSVVDGGLIEVTTGGSISHSSSDLRVGVDGGPGSFTLSGGGVGVRAASIGSGQGVTSFLTVTSGTWTGSGALTVASAGANSVFQLDGGSVSSLSSTIGTGVSDMTSDVSNGSARINGGTWTTTNGLVLGTAGGTGSLTLAGGAVNSGSGTIGDDLGSTGSADVTGGTWTNSGDLTVGGAGSGTLSMSGAGTVIVGGMLFRGTGGTINLSSGGTLQIGNGGNSGSITESLTTNGTLVFDRSDTYDLVHEIDGSGSVVKEGSGTLILSTANFWSGGTTINDGALEVGVEGALGSDGTISFGGGALRLYGGDFTAYSERFNSSGNQQFKLDTYNEPVTLGSVIAGAGSTLEKLGGGTLILAEDSTYNGTTTVSAGTLQIGNGMINGSISGDLVNNATVVFNRQDIFDVGNDISGTGALETVGAGTVTLTGNNSYTGATILTSGVLSLGSATALGSTSSIDFSGGSIGGTLQFTEDNDADPSASFSTAANQAYKLDTNGQDVTLSANLTSTDSTLEKFGAGTLTLSGNNTFAGGTTLFGGTLSLDSASALGDPNDAFAGTISFAGGTLQYTDNNDNDYSARFSTAANQAFSIDTNGQTVTFANALTSSNATLTKLGSGTLTLAPTGNNDLGGGVVLDDGTLRLGSGGAISGHTSSIEFNGGTLQFTADNTVDVSARISTADGQAFNIDTDGADVTFATPLQGIGSALTKLGSGTLTLSADNTYDGTTTISAGTLRIGDGGDSGQVAGDIVNNAALVFDRSDVPTYSNAISGNGSLTQQGTGTLVLTGNNSYTGGTNLDGGVLALGSPDAIGSSGTITFGGGTLRYNGANQVDYSSRISTAGGQAIRIDTSDENVDFLTGLAGVGSTLEKLGGGTLTLSAASTYSGGTTVSGGTLEVASTGSIAHASTDLVVGTTAGNGTLVVNGGSVSVRNATLGRDDGRTGALTVDNGGTFTSSGTLLVGNNGDSASGTFTVAGGTVTTAAATIGAGSGNGTATVSGGSWTNSGDLAVGNGTLTISSGTVTVGGTLSDSSQFGIALQGGELRIGTGGAGGVLQANVNLHGSLVLNSSSDSSYDREIDGSGTLTKAGSGTLTLTSDGTYGYSGLTTVSAGGLVIDGLLVNSSVVVGAGGLLGGSGTVAGQVTVNSGGVIGPSAAGDPSILTVGDLLLQAGSQTKFGILGDGSLAGDAGTHYGQLKINNSPIALNGTLRLDFGNASPFATGQVFQLFVLDGGSPIGHLSSVIAAGTGVYANLGFTRTDDTWTSTPTGAGQTLRFNETTGALIVLAVVPEPSTWGMLLAGSAAVVLVRGRRRFQKTLGM